MFPPLMAQAGREHAGMPDIYISFFYWLAVWITWEMQKSQSKTNQTYYWWLVPIVIIGSLIKTEGILLIIFLLLSSQSWKTKLPQIIFASSGFLGWQLILHFWQIPSSYALTLPNIMTILQRLLIMIPSILSELFFNIHNWYIFWWVFVLAILANRRTSLLNKKLKQLGLYLIIGLMGIYLFSSIPINGYVSSSFDRLMLQIMPVWFVFFTNRIFPFES